VYRLITGNTYEREMFDKASLKLGLDKAVLQSMGNKELSMVCAVLLLGPAAECLLKLVKVVVILPILSVYG